MLAGKTQLAGLDALAQYLDAVLAVGEADLEVPVRAVAGILVVAPVTAFQALEPALNDRPDIFLLVITPRKLNQLR